MGRNHDDLFRSAIILPVAAMDAYFTDRFCEGLIPYLKKYELNRTLVKVLVDSGFDTETALGMYKMKRPDRRLSNLVKKKYDTKVTQNLRKVDDLYKAFGYPNPTTFAQGLAKKKNLMRRVQLLVARRHKMCIGATIMPTADLRL